MKKNITLLLSLALFTSLTACGGTSDSGNDRVNSADETTADSKSDEESKNTATTHELS